MFKLAVVSAAAVFALQLGSAGAASLGGAAPDTTPRGAFVLVAGKKAFGTIPANCTIDPFKTPKVYVCCDGPDNCKEYPIDHDFPVVRQFHLQQVKPLQSQPLTADPGVSQ
jgi:hypothetical protein